MNKTYIVAGRHPWNRAHFDKQLADLPGEWRFAATEEELKTVLDDDCSVRYVFFLHWSTKVPDQMLERWECVCFHMTDVPYGRGGSPLQNLIARGHRETKLTALRMTQEFDAGPVYFKSPLSLEGSSAEEIFVRASQLSCELIKQIIKSESTPSPQTGAETRFRRRKKSESVLTEDYQELLEIHDFIRMLDADGYPKARIHLGSWIIEFNRSALYHDHIKADAKIFRNSEEEPS